MLLDSGIWIALSLAGHQYHSAVKQWFDSVLELKSFAFCRATQQSYLRLMCSEPVHRACGSVPLSNADAWAAYEAIIADPRVFFLVDPPGLEHHWKRFTSRSTASPKVWMDGYLAALALTTNQKLVSLDRAFSQFSGLDLLLLP